MNAGVISSFHLGPSQGLLFFISRMMPMTCCLDLMRAVVYIGMPEYKSVVMSNPVVTLTAIVTITVLCLIVGTFFFARSQKNR